MAGGSFLKASKQYYKNLKDAYAGRRGSLLTFALALTTEFGFGGKAAAKLIDPKKDKTQKC
jgi:hypothetical protein